MDINRSKEFRDKETVDTSQKWELDHWTDKWGITEEQLFEAIEKTGTHDVSTLEKYLINK
jgi:hypothetical protein